MTSPMPLPEPQFLRWMRNAGFSSLAMKCWHGPHDRGSIHGHRHTETDHLRHTDGNHRRARGAIKVTDQLNDPHASVFPPATAIRKAPI